MMLAPEITDREFLRRYRERQSAEKMLVNLQHGNSGQGLRCVVVDMHEDGVGLWTEQMLEVDDQVFLSIAVKAAYALDVKAEVKHVREIGKDIYQVGVEFVKSHPSYYKGRDALRRMENYSLEMQLAEFYEDTAVEMVRADKC